MSLGLAALLGGTVGPVIDTVWASGAVLLGNGTVQNWARAFRQRAAGRLALPENHDLVRGIRTAHLAAVDRVARRHAKVLRALPDHEIGAGERPFRDGLRRALDERLKLLHGGSIDFDAVDEAQVASVLDEMVHPSALEGYAAAASAARRAAEQRALAELTELAGRPPPLFIRCFAGDGEPGWYDVFALFVNEEIKTSERFRSIFLAAELVDLKRLVAAAEARITAAVDLGVERLDVRLAEVAGGVAAVRADTTAILSAQEQLLALNRRQIELLEQDKGIPHAALVNHLVRLGADERIEQAQVPAVLERFAGEFVALREQWTRATNAAPGIAAAREEALGFLATGDLDAARRLFRATRERVPLDWAITQNNLGEAFVAMAEKSSGADWREQAIAAFESALEVFASATTEYYRDYTQRNLDRARNIAPSNSKV